MKFNFNGNLIDAQENILGINHHIVTSNDLIKETIKVEAENILYWEEHYFNLMASMRIYRMQIPNTFTPEFLANEVQKTLVANKISQAIVQIAVFRNDDSSLLITKSTISFAITIQEQNVNKGITWINEPSEIDIYKDFVIYPNFFSQVKTNKPEENIIKAYLQENDYQDLVILNHEKKIAKTLLGSLFLVQGKTIKTTKITEGGVRSVWRNQLCKILNASDEIDFEETTIFPFELQKTDELFVCIEGYDIRSITQNRKKTYTTSATEQLIEIINSNLGQQVR